MSAAVTPCPACAESAWRPWRELATWRYVRCQGCGLARLDPLPAEADLAEVFDDGYFVDGGARGGYVDYDADGPTHRLNAEHRVAALPGPVGRLVDVGCASGYTLDEAARQGWSVAGVEVSPTVAAKARANGHRVEADLADLADLSGGVDVVTFFQVLEHLADPVAALTRAAGLLRPGGHVVVETWDAGSLVARLSGRHWQQLSPPSVVWVLDEPSAATLFGRAGLALEQWRRTGKSVSAGLVLGQLAPRLPGPLAAGARTAGRLVGGVRLRYGLGDLVTLTARGPV